MTEMVMLVGGLMYVGGFIFGYWVGRKDGY